MKDLQLTDIKKGSLFIRGIRRSGRTSLEEFAERHGEEFSEEMAKMFLAGYWHGVHDQRAGEIDDAIDRERETLINNGVGLMTADDE